MDKKTLLMAAFAALDHVPSGESASDEEANMRKLNDAAIIEVFTADLEDRLKRVVDRGTDQYKNAMVGRSNGKVTMAFVHAGTRVSSSVFVQRSDGPLTVFTEVRSGPDGEEMKPSHCITRGYLRNYDDYRAALGMVLDIIPFNARNAVGLPELKAA